MHVAISIDDLRSIAVEPNHRDLGATAVIRFRNAAGDDLLSVEVPVTKLHVRTQIALSHLSHPPLHAADTAAAVIAGTTATGVVQ